MTGTILLLLGIGGLAYYFLKKRTSENEEGSNTQASTQRPTAYAKDDLRIENVAAGGMIHVSGIGAEMEEFDVSILAKHLYRDEGSSWYELEGESINGKVWIDLEEGDDLALSITLKKVKLRDIGLSKKDLKQIDDDEEGKVRFEGQTYNYEDSDEATFYRNGDESQGERYYYWDFENDDEDKFIGVEKWADGSYDVSYSEEIEAHQLTVFSLKK